MPCSQGKYIISVPNAGRLLFICLISSLFPAVATAQRYRFDSWTTDNGLPQVSINSILQTRDGFLWFTTFGGLVRYDGLRFHVFNTGNTSELRTGRFTQMAEDRDGNLWINTEGQGLIRYRNGGFTTYTTEDGLPDNTVGKISRDRNGALLIESEGKIMRWDEDKVVAYIPPDGEPTQNILFRTPTGSIWHTDNNHLRKFENGRTTFDFASDSQILRIYEDSQNRVWLAEAGKNELLTIENGKIRTHRLNDGYSPFRFSSILEDRRKGLWFNTANGLVLLRDGEFKRFTTADGLIDNRIRYVYEDREGTLWVGTEGGLNHLTERAMTDYSSKDGLAGDNVYTIYQDRSERIWIGSWQGLTVYENRAFQNVGARFSVADTNVTALLEDRQANMWIGTWDGGVRKIKNGSVTTFQPGTITSAPIRVIYQDSTDNLWFGTSRGLIRYKDDIPTIYTVKDGLIGKEIFAIHEDRAKKLWIGTEAGLMRYDNNTFTYFRENSGPAGKAIRAIYEDSDGTLWIGTYDGGLYRLKDNRFTHYTNLTGLYDNGVFQIIEDDRGNFWISCNLGIYRVKKSDLNDFAEGRVPEITSIPYNKRDGMLSSECNGGFQPAGIRANDGRIWFPTQKGVTVIDAASVPFNNEPPPVVIQTLLVDTRPVDVTAAINIEPGQTNLEIQYSGLSFINPELVKFRYKLEGLDAGWIDVGTRRSAYYSHLPPGKYQFKVLAANRDNVWNEEGATIEINVLPAFWQTWWFWNLIGLSVSVVIFAIYRWRMTTLRRTNALREMFARQLIESQEDERKRIAVELHDSLGQSLVLIKNWALVEIKSSAAGKNRRNKTLQEITEMASRAINEVREIAYNLGPYQLEKLGLRKSIEEMIAKAADSSAIKFKVEVEDIDEYFTKQSQINIFRIIQEAVSNIVKHSEAQTAEISMKIAQPQIRLTIQDNGKGFDQTASEDMLGKRGFGLLGMSERVHLLKGEYRIESETGKGTTVFVNLPYDKSFNKF